MQSLIDLAEGGCHYQRTLEAWLDRLDERRAVALEVLADIHGPDHAARQLQKWRPFLMACSELFGFAGGNDWYVAHYRFSRRAMHTLRPSVSSVAQGSTAEVAGSAMQRRTGTR